MPSRSTESCYQTAAVNQRPFVRKKLDPSLTGGDSPPLRVRETQTSRAKELPDPNSNSLR